MKEEIIKAAGEIAEVLEKEYDVAILKRAKDGTLKIMYYKPRNVKRKN